MDHSGGASGVSHLRGYRALPNQLIQLELHRLQRVFNLTGGTEVVTSRADSFVCFLGALVFGGVNTWLFGHILATVKLADLGAGGGHSLAGKRGGVGTHIGDVPGLV